MSDGERLESRAIYDGRIVKLSVDTVRLPGGHEAKLEMIRHPGASAIVPIDAAGRVLLVRQYRYASGGFLLEVPAGTLNRGEQPERCARRETEEETGHSVGRLIPMGWIWTTPGFTDEKIWLFAATDLTPTAQELDSDEVLTVERVALTDAVDMAARGEIVDGKSICALLRTPHFLTI